MLHKHQQAQPQAHGQRSRGVRVQAKYCVVDLIITSLLCTGDTPTMPQLMAFPVQGGDSIDFTLEIGNSYKKFGIFILNDSKGTTMNSLESQHLKNSEEILHDVFSRWLEGKSLQCTWEKLLECLRLCRCNTLADQLEKNLA